MTWLLIGALVWVALAVPAALLIARSIRTADAHRVAESEAQSQDANFVASEEPPAEASLPWTGPATVPFPPPPPKQRPPHAPAPPPPTEAAPPSAGHP